MQTVSNAYRTIIADPGHIVEWRITIGSTVYGMDRIVRSVNGADKKPKLSRALISGSEPEVGRCCATTFSCTLIEASSSVPRMAAVEPAFRIVSGASASEWIPLGTFFIDVRTEDATSGTLQLSCFDRMLVADGIGGKSYADVTGFSTWPQPQRDVAAEIAQIMGVALDARTTIGTGSGYMVDYPSDLTMREVLGYIAVANAGNWTVTPGNALRLVPLIGTSDSVSLGTDLEKLQTAPALSPWSAVTVYWADEEAYEAGDDTGRRLVCDCPWATQATADGILAAIQGNEYQPFTADDAMIDLAAELGDIATVGPVGGSVAGPVLSLAIVFDSIEQATVAAPGEAEIDHEYPYASYVDRSLRRKVSLGKSYYGTSISRERGIVIERSDGKSEATFNSDLFQMSALVEGVMTPRIYFDPIKGDYVFDGALGADAVFTDSLYAETGEVAELTVDRLTTSRRIRKYILGDQTDDNYVRIQDQYVRFVTGTLNPDVALLTESGLMLLTEDGKDILAESWDAPAPIQAENRYGQPLYWQREPVGHTSDGYPTDADGVQIYAGTDETDWPVYTYAYAELTKAEFAFESYTTSQGVETYAPVITMGAGDPQGNSKGYLLKEQNDMILRYVTAEGESTDVRLSDFVDAKHRRLASCSIDTAMGEIAYTVEGDENEYGLSFSVDGDTVTYTWPDGFSCEVTVT